MQNIDDLIEYVDFHAKSWTTFRPDTTVLLEDILEKAKELKANMKIGDSNDKLKHITSTRPDGRI